MNELIGKLTNLSYEFFGILIPGAVITLFLAIWWVSLGNIPSEIISRDIPQIYLSDIASLSRRAFSENGLGIFIPFLFAWYIFGHITQWYSRSSYTESGERASNFARLFKSLQLKPPRPKENYSKDLEPLFQEASKHLSKSGEPLSWSQFFPVAKNLVIRKSSYSLIATYQNKYTLHRSITIASAFLFWLNIIGISLSLILTKFCLGSGTITNITLQLFLIPATLFLIWGFSGGYEFNWRMFGNTIVTESYSILSLPDSKKDATDE